MALGNLIEFWNLTKELHNRNHKLSTNYDPRYYQHHKNFHFCMHWLIPKKIISQKAFYWIFICKIAK